ncbi:MAG: helix-turn-helix domain-containing protein [Pseudomonadota bacterium]
MPRSLHGSIVGARIRARRREIGLTQAELARRAGISPSYLNLIESNKRAIAGKLLGTIAGEIGIRREDLDGEAERRLAGELAEIAADPRLAGQAVSSSDTGELIGRFPGWARTLVSLARSERELAALTRALSDRLTHDPFLGEAVHRMLTHIASLRSAAEILRDVPEIEAEDRARFVGILAEESGRLSEVGTALAGYFDRADEARQAITPDDEVEALFDRRANHFAEIEEAVARGGTAEDAIAAVLQAAASIESGQARAAAEHRLDRYAKDAADAPAATVLEAGAACGFDAELVAARLGIGVDTAFRRLACLPPPEEPEDHPRFGYIETNAAGTVTEFYGLPGLVPPRTATPCPLWIQFRAAAQPGQSLRQLAAFPTGLAFLFVARARPSKAPGFGQATLPVTDLLVIEPKAAERTVYGEGLAALSHLPARGLSAPHGTIETFVNVRCAGKLRYAGAAGTIRIRGAVPQDRICALL